MNKELIDFVKFLYNEKPLTIDSINKAFDYLVNEKHLTKYELICDFENDMLNNIKDFKTEILDYLLILLAQMKDIQQIKEVYDKLKTIQSMLKTYLKDVAEAEYEASDARAMREEQEELEELYGYKASPDELPIYRC